MLGYKHTQPCLTCYGDSEDSTVGPSACKASISYPVSWATDLSEHPHACIALYIVLQSPQPWLWPTGLYSYNLMLSFASRHQNSKLNLPSINYLSQTSSYLTIQFIAIVTFHFDPFLWGKLIQACSISCRLCEVLSFHILFYIAP